MKRAVLVLALLLAACDGSSDGDASDAGVAAISSALDVTYTNNYGVVSIAGQALCWPGVDMTTKCAYLIFWRTDNTCQVNPLGFALTNSISIYGGTVDGGWANMAVVGSGQTRDVYCANDSRGVYHLSQLNQNGYQVSMFGTAAGDYMNCSGDPGAVVVCYGQGGNDIMEDTMNLHVDMHGNAGDDRIRVLSLPTSNIGPNLFGDEGNDCLYSPSNQAWLDCGTGTDTANRPGQSCETVVSTTCP